MPVFRDFDFCSPQRDGRGRRPLVSNFGRLRDRPAHILRHGRKGRCPRINVGDQPLKNTMSMSYAAWSCSTVSTSRQLSQTKTSSSGSPPSLGMVRINRIGSRQHGQSAVAVPAKVVG